jgi:hypothetical protein
MTESEERARFESEYAAQFGANRDDPRVVHLFNRGEDGAYENRGVGQRWAGWEMRAAQAQRGEGWCCESCGQFFDQEQPHGHMGKAGEQCGPVSRYDRAEGAGKVDGLAAWLYRNFSNYDHPMPSELCDADEDTKRIWGEFAREALAQRAHPAPGADGAVEEEPMKQGLVDEFESALNELHRSEKPDAWHKANARVNAARTALDAALADARAAQRDGEGKP